MIKMKRRLLIVLVLVSTVLMVACKNGLPGFSEESITLTIAESNKPNFVTLKCIVPGEGYDSIVWILPDGQQFSQLNTFTVYFPNKGEYEVKVAITKGNKTAEIKKKVVIPSDDSRLAAGEQLVWHDEFDGYTLNQDWWSNDLNVHVNNEWQTYTDGDNIRLADGLLIITARKAGEGQKEGDYTSGRVKSEGKKEFTYGRMEMRAKLPGGRGTWPALWMLGANCSEVGWPACGELDVMEHVGFDPGAVHSSIHTPSSCGNTVNTSVTRVETFETEFHTYGMYWTPEKIDFYVDSPENVFYTYAPEVKNDETWPFDKPFFFILNQAVGGHWGGAQGVDDSIFPKEMYVEYVRVYQNIK